MQTQRGAHSDSKGAKHEATTRAPQSKKIGRDLLLKAFMCDDGDQAPAARATHL